MKNQSFKVPAWLQDKIKKTFPGENAILLEMQNNPAQLGDLLKESSKKIFTPMDIILAFDQGKEQLLFQQAKTASDKWNTYKQYVKVLGKFNEKNFNVHA
jgi:hypothetical protein